MGCAGPRFGSEWTHVQRLHPPLLQVLSVPQVLPHEPQFVSSLSITPIGVSESKGRQPPSSQIVVLLLEPTPLA